MLGALSLSMSANTIEICFSNVSFLINKRRASLPNPLLWSFLLGIKIPTPIDWSFSEKLNASKIPRGNLFSEFQIIHRCCLCKAYIRAGKKQSVISSSV